MVFSCTHGLFGGESLFFFGVPSSGEEIPWFGFACLLVGYIRAFLVMIFPSLCAVGYLVRIMRKSNVSIVQIAVVYQSYNQSSNVFLFCFI